MSIKVVYNSRYGGFSISRACAERMAELGNKEAAELIADCDDRFYGYLEETPRHDPALVRAVEELGDDAGGNVSKLCVHELIGRKYIIESYDGLETVVEPEDIRWIVV
tara:strand:+ start:572 stop:895 length:324 start_codon:yes stop_codon:yes gene_type:complete